MSQLRDTPHLRDTLGQMLAVLQAERQALAGLDLDAILGAAAENWFCQLRPTAVGPDRAQ